jgi:DNA-binding CsgD family transcriptional regulator
MPMHDSRVYSPFPQQVLAESSGRKRKLLVCEPDRLPRKPRDFIKQLEFHIAAIVNLEDLLRAIDTIAPDTILLSKEFLIALLNGERGQDTEDLEHALNSIRRRDADVIRMLAKGLHNHEIAGSLGLSERTVKSILSNLYLRYDVTNRTELLGLLMEEGHSRAVREQPLQLSAQQSSGKRPRSN